jgi:hypothetical protein
MTKDMVKSLIAGMTVATLLVPVSVGSIRSVSFKLK